MLETRTIYGPKCAIELLKNNKIKPKKQTQNNKHKPKNNKNKPRNNKKHSNYAIWPRNRLDHWLGVRSRTRFGPQHANHRISRLVSAKSPRSMDCRDHLRIPLSVSRREIVRASEMLSENSFEIGWFWWFFMFWGTFEGIFATLIDSEDQKFFWQKSGTTSDTLKYSTCESIYRIGKTRLCRREAGLERMDRCPFPKLDPIAWFVMIFNFSRALSPSNWVRWSIYHFMVPNAL